MNPDSGLDHGYMLEPVTRAGEIIAYLLKDPAGNTIADYSASRINAAVARMRRLNRGRQKVDAAL